MATKFDDFYKEIEDEAKAEGADALAQLNLFKIRFRIGRRVAEARLKMKLSQEEVARLARIDQAEVSRIETGKANPTVETLSAVAAAVGLSPDLVEASSG